MALTLSDSLQALVHKSYEKAKASGALSFASSEVHTLYTNSNVPFQLRYCPSLAEKPVANKPDDGRQLQRDGDQRPKKKIDVFDNPTGDLVISNQLSLSGAPKPSHILVLNKFPIIPNHFILATKEFKEQTDDLEADDLKVTYELLKAWRSATSLQSSPALVKEEQTGGIDRGGELFAFFNSGPHSGASQPHRHVQFLPVEDMVRNIGLQQQQQQQRWPSWSLLIHDKARLKQLPITTFQEDVSPSSHGEVSAESLHVTYQRLLRSCREAWARHAGKSAGVSAAEFSYNLGMTTSSIVLVPRTHEGVMLKRDDGAEIGYVALNGTLLGGTVMVKRAEEWDHLRQMDVVIDGILQGICLPGEREKM